jgi:hypothetical protein
MWPLNRPYRAPYCWTRLERRDFVGIAGFGSATQIRADYVDSQKHKRHREKTGESAKECRRSRFESG